MFQGINGWYVINSCLKGNLCCCNLRRQTVQLDPYFGYFDVHWGLPVFHRWDFSNCCISCRYSARHLSDGDVLCWWRQLRRGRVRHPLPRSRFSLFFFGFFNCIFASVSLSPLKGRRRFTVRRRVGRQNSRPVTPGRPDLIAAMAKFKIDGS